MPRTKQQFHDVCQFNMQRFNQMFPGYHEKYVGDQVCYHCVNAILAKCDLWIKNGAIGKHFGDIETEYRELINLISMSRSGKTIIYHG